MKRKEQLTHEKLEWWAGEMPQWAKALVVRAEDWSSGTGTRVAERENSPQQFSSDLCTSLPLSPPPFLPAPTPPLPLGQRVLSSIVGRAGQEKQSSKQSSSMASVQFLPQVPTLDSLHDRV